MDKTNIIEQLEALQNKVDAMGFKGQNEYDLHLREEIADWILNSFLKSECQHPYWAVVTKCFGEINHCTKCGKDL